jgi:tetratricopeptide (TPR) repeat protein
LQAALNLAQARLEVRPGDLEARIAICRIRLLQGSLDEARKILTETEQIIERLAQVYAAIGESCLKRGMREAAEDYYEKYRRLHPGAPPVPNISDWFGEDPMPHETEGEGEAERAAPVPPDFQTVTLAELYIRQGHFRPAEEVLEKIIGEDPQNGKAAMLLAEVREQFRRTGSAPPETGVAAELSHWLENIGRLRGRAA